MPQRSISWSTLSWPGRRQRPHGRRRGAAEDARGRAAAGRSTGFCNAGSCAAAAADVEQFQAVADGDVGDRAALGGHDDRDPVQGQPGGGFADRAGLASRGQPVEPGRVAGAGHLGGQPLRGGRGEQPAQAGRITSAQISDSRPVPTTACRPGGPTASRPCATGPARLSSRARPSWSAPLARHRCCQVSPGWACSQSSTMPTPRRRFCSPARRCRGERRRGQQPRPARRADSRVRGQASGSGRGGNRAAARRPGRPAAAPAGAAPGRRRARPGGHHRPGPNSTFSDSGPVARGAGCGGGGLLLGAAAGGRPARRRSRPPAAATRTAGWWTAGRGQVPTARRLSLASAEVSLTFITSVSTCPDEG